jgi:AcrR family transcriptional regulator
MSNEPATVGLRERNRRAVRAELIEAAQDLFVAQGFEATTVDQIAVAVGMAKRTFFRYFPSKEDLVLGKYDATAERLVESLEGRPLDEPVWSSLRRVFDYVVDYTADAASAARMAELDRVIQADPSLRASYLQRLDAMEVALADAVRRRAEAAGRPWVDDDPRPAAIVGAAFACLRAASAVAATSGRELAAVLDDAMAGVAPAGQDR